MSVSTRGAIAVTRLRLTDFRCYATLRLEVDARPVVLAGPNGAGKTNLLEALSFLAPGRGLRRARLDSVDRHDGQGPWAVAATVEGPHGPVEIGTGRTEEGERRIVRIGGETARSQAALAEHVNIVWLTPSMDRLFLGGAAERRRFLDRLVYGFDPAHAGRVAGYENAMRQRARLLREGCRHAAWLDALEQAMAERGVAVAAARRDMATRLARACTIATGTFPKATIAAVGTVEDWLAEAPALEVEERLRRALADNRQRDAESGSTAIGPHRSDLAVAERTRGIPAQQCSTGEQKALLISIVLADARLRAAERGATPILLLDEVAAHLDRRRREDLFAEIVDLGAQVWLAGTDAGLFAPLGDAAQFFAVEDAALRPVS